jgi:gamma-glutamylcyclotransferase (GGCT)/AIG2-like uncharacterized protein YtfP
MPLLFSYGTLRDPAVQQANFGRVLDGRPDSVVGFRVREVEIRDPAVVALSGLTHHPILFETGKVTDTVPGAVFALTDDELLRADEYEVDDYRRVEASLASGGTAWVYVA